MAENDGLIDVTLERDYGPHKAGERVRVDPERMAWILEHLPPLTTLAAHPVFDSAPDAELPRLEEVADA
jgi:hypothetical protein